MMFLLQMFCIADPAYDKSLQQLQSFLSGLVAEEKLELRDGMYYLKKWWNCSHPYCLLCKAPLLAMESSCLFTRLQMPSWSIKLCIRLSWMVAWCNAHCLTQILFLFSGLNIKLVKLINSVLFIWPKCYIFVAYLCIVFNI